jgi:hypothetical protein
MGIILLVWDLTSHEFQLLKVFSQCKKKESKTEYDFKEHCGLKYI